MKITAKEFDRRFDKGEDIFDLMDNPKSISMTEFKNEFLEKKETTQNSITIDLNGVLIQKLKEKADTLNVKIDDLIKMILADRLGV